MSRKTALIGVLAALAIIFGYVEMLLPISIGIPGVKLGLANIVVLSVLYVFNTRTAAMISIVRIVVIGFLFSNLYSILYSLSGAILSITVMCLLKRFSRFSVYGVSVAGGVAHNIGQLIMAACIVSTPAIMNYFPVLLVSGCITGFLIGHLAAITEKRIAQIAYSEGKDL